MSKFCMGCMSQIEEGFGICPHCEYVEDTNTEDALHLEPSSILRERYIIGKALGFGGFGVTYIGWDATLEQKVAIKEYLPSEFSTRVPGHTQISIFSGDKAEQFQDGLVKFVEEAQRLAKFHKESGVVRIFDSFQANNTAYIVMEYLQGETLAKYLKREKTVSADKAISLLLPVIHSLQVINERGIIHRDIAPDNIFLTNDGKVKLIDFGAARFATTSHSRSLTIIIKPGYSPEEQYRSRGDQGSYTDVYAIGATLYRMITGEVPPDAFERRAHFENSKKDILKPLDKFTRNISENQENAILNALNVRIEDRTQDMATLARELTTELPEKVKRLHGKIRRLQLYRLPLWAKIATPAAMLTTIVLSILLGFGVIGFDARLQTEIDIPYGMSRVPSVVSSDMEQAETRLNDATLLFTITGRAYSDRIPANLVLTQNINAGSVVIINTIVEITISGGAETDIEPDVIPNLHLLVADDAIQILGGLGISAEIEYASSETIASGLVISQFPEAGTNIAYGESVSIIVSTGSPSFAMPDVVGMTTREASTILIENNLSVSVEYENSDDVTIGRVISQSIEPGTDVNRGNHVTITISIERGQVHTVAAGDSMQRIAMMYYGISTPEIIAMIAEVNELDSPAYITVGQQLIIPALPEIPATPTPRPTPAGTVTGISIRSLPTTTTFAVDESVNTAGLTLNVYWSDGRTTTSSDNFLISPREVRITGEQTITVFYQGATTTFSVTVN